MKRIKLHGMNCETVAASEIGNFVVDTVVQNRSSGCIVGLSGGVDSSTTAALINTAFERHNKNRNANLELVGYILPSNLNKMEDAKDAEILARKLGIRYEIHALDKLVEAFKTTNYRHYQKLGGYFAPLGGCFVLLVG